MIRYSDVLVDRGHLEVRPHDFYRDLFSQTELYRHYGRDLWFPLVLSEGGADGGGTWRSKLNLDAVLDVSEGRSDAYLAPCTFFHGRLWRSCSTSTGVIRRCSVVLWTIGGLTGRF